jgi:uncharacterized membrane protein YbhN (UPF0104 family)
MKIQVVIFLCGLVLGGFLRLWFVGIKAASKKHKSKVVTFVFEFLGVGVFTLGLILTLFYFNNGVFAPFAPVAAVIGFGVVSLIT